MHSLRSLLHKKTTPTSQMSKALGKHENSMLDRRKCVPNVEGTDDKIHRLIRTAIGLSPLCSGTLLEAFNVLWRPPAEERAERWMHDVIDALNAISKDLNNLGEKVLKNEEFTSLLISANHLVIKNHQPEKVVYFKNLVINGLIDSKTSYDKKTSFLSLLDQLTLTHIRVLHMLKDGIIWGVHQETTEARYPYYLAKRLLELEGSFSGDQFFIEQIVRELSQKNLFHDIQLVKVKGQDVVNVGSHAHTDVGVIGLEIPKDVLPETKFSYQSRVNVHGFNFLRFIAEFEVGA